MTDEKDLDKSPDENEPKGSESADDSSGEGSSADLPDGEAANETPDGEAVNEAPDATPDSGSDDQASEVKEDAAEVSGDAASEAADSGSGDQAVEAEEEADEEKIVNPDDESEDDAEAAMMAMLEELPDEASSAKAEDINFGAPKVAEAEFQQLSEPAGSSDKANIDMLMDVDLPVAIELGRTEMTINDILALGPGSVVELSKLAGEPVDLLVNSKVVARGEVVVVDENFGLRVTHLLTPEERLKCLAEA